MILDGVPEAFSSVLRWVPFWGSQAGQFMHRIKRQSGGDNSTWWHRRLAASSFFLQTSDYRQAVYLSAGGGGKLAQLLNGQAVGPLTKQTGGGREETAGF